MSQIFTETWMLSLQKAWNTNERVHQPLQAAKFNSRMGYGFKGEPRARDLLVVKMGWWRVPG